VAQELLVIQQLTEEMIKAGGDLVRLLDSRRFLVRAALWLYSSEKSEWRLVLATPEARIEGPKRIYKRLQSALAKEGSSLPLSALTVVDTQDTLIQSLGSVMRVDGVSGNRFSRNTINGRYIEDAYIYRLTL
jgi:hypothetical protein